MQEGLLRVILDGGPTRIFFPNDSKLLEDDLEVLKVTLSPCIQKLNIFHCCYLDRNFLVLIYSIFENQEFFISGGDGLPRGTVENLVARVRHVITLIGYEVI